MAVRMKNLSIIGSSLKNSIFREGGFPKNQFLWGNCLKGVGVGLGQCPDLREGLARKKGRGCFWGGTDTLMHTMIKWWYLQVFFFNFFKILIFRVVSLVKGQKMTQNVKKFCLSCFISHEPYIIWLSYMVHMCKMIISPNIFSFFQNVDFPGC